GITLGGVSGATIRNTGGKLTLGTSGATSGINGNGSAITLDTSGGSIIVNSVVSGAASSVTKIGADNATFSGNNTFAGPLTVSSGMLSVGSIDPLMTNPQPLGT